MRVKPHCFGINGNHIAKINFDGKIVLMDMNCHLCLVSCVIAKAGSCVFAKAGLFAKGAGFGGKSQ
jgi:hypothetical protein